MLGSFGPVNEKNSFRVSKCDKNEVQANENFQVWDILLKKDIGGNKWTMAQIVSAQPDSCAKCSAEGDWCIEQKR